MARSEFRLKCKERLVKPHRRVPKGTTEYKMYKFYQELLKETAIPD